MPRYAFAGEWIPDPGLANAVMPVHCQAMGRRPENPQAVAPGAGPAWVQATQNGTATICGVSVQVFAGDYYPQIATFTAAP